MDRQVVVLQLNDESYAIDISGVKEIVRLPEITRVPHAPPYVEGVIDLRGQVTPVINLQDRFGLSRSEVSKNTRVIVLTVGASQFGVVVDGVTETLNVPEDAVDGLATTGLAVDAEYVTGIARLDSGLVILLDYERILDGPEQEQLSAITEEQGAAVA